MSFLLAYGPNAKPSFSGTPTISGTLEVGQTLTATWTAAKQKTATVRWYRRANEGAAAVEIGTGTTYALTGNETATQIKFDVVASNNAGSTLASSAWSAAVGVVAPPDPPTIVTPATITGDLEVGATLTVTYDFDGESSVAIQWFSYTSQGGSGGSELGTSATQAMAELQEGRYIGCVVTATNASGSTVSTATIVGPIVVAAGSAPAVVSVAGITLDEGADGVNEGEYLVCEAAFSGHTSTPTFTWYKCDAGKANAEELVGAGEATTQPLPVSQPNTYRGALFLAQSLGLNAANKYVYCVASATNSEGTTTSESDAAGPVGAIQGTAITAAMVGAGPYYLPTANTSYYLTEDITVDGSAFIINKANQKLNLNGKTVTFDNAAPIISSNAGFEDGATDWDWTDTGNAGAGAGTIGTATYADIYTAASHELGFNLKRLSSGTKSLVFKNAACADNGVYHFIKRSVTLEHGKSYTISFSVYRGGSNCTPYVRLRHAVDGSVAVAFVTGSISALFGFRYVEAMFYARHDPAEYTLEVGVLGQTGATGDCYIDDVKVARTRTVGVLVTNETEFNNTTASHATVTSGGSGYTPASGTATYNNVLSTYVSGGSPSTAPTVSVTVTDGAVSAVAVSSSAGGRFIIPGSVFTVSNSLIGGTGSGLQFAISGVKHHYGSNIATTSFTNGSVVPNVYPLEQISRFNSATFGRVKNGTITQGQDNGTWPAAVNCVIHDHAVHRITATLTGENASAIRHLNTTGKYITVKDCTFNCNWTVSGDRQYFWGNALYCIGGVIARNRFYNYPIGAIYPQEALNAYGNTFQAKQRWSNGYACLLGNRPGQAFHDNVIDNTGSYYGRGIAIGGNEQLFTSGQINIYANRITMHPTRFNSEYGGMSAFGDHALQVEGLYAGSTVNIYGNTITANASGSPTISGNYIMANAMAISGIRSGSVLNLYGNDVTASASDAAYASILYLGGASTSSQTLGTINWSVGGSREHWDSNSIYVRGAGDLVSEFVADVDWTTPGANEKRPLIAEYESSSAPISLDFRDCTFGTGALAEIAVAKVWEDPRWGTNPAPSSYGTYYVRWTTTFDVGQEGATVNVKYGGSTIATGTSSSNGLCNIEVPQYAMTGSTLTDYNSGGGLTVEATKDALTGSASFTADAIKTVTVSMS